MALEKSIIITSLFMVDWLSRHIHNENKDKEITGMQISINAIQSTNNILECLTIHELYEATPEDQHLMEYIIQGGLTAKTNYHKTSEHTGHSEMTWQLLMR